MKSDSIIISIIYSFLRKTLGPIIKLVWVKNVTGRSNIPKSGTAIFAMNHQSFIDFITFSVVCPRNVHFLAAEKFFNSLFWKPVMILTGQIKVDRNLHDKSTVHDIVKKHVAKGTVLGIFPEGTRSHSESEMLKAYNGVAKYALEHRVPIIPVGIVGAHSFFSKNHPMIGFKKSVEIHIGKPLYFEDCWDKHHDKLICTLVTEKVMKEIEILSGKKYKHYELTN